MKDKVARILAAPGWSQVKLAEETEASQSSVHRWSTGVVEPRGSHRDKVNAIFDRLHQPIELRGKPDATSELLQSQNAAILATETAEGRRIVVYGQAVAGLNGEFIMNGSELFEVLAPPNLQSKDSYAVQFSGDSMHPRYDDGMIGFVDPSRRPKKGDYVVAQVQTEEHGPILAYAKQLVRWNSSELVLYQLNPPEDPDRPGTLLEHEMRFPGDQVKDVHVIVMAGEA